MSTQTITPDPLAQYRRQVAVAKEQKPKRAMAAKSVERLRTLNQEARLEQQALDRFATSISSIEPTLPNLARLIEKCSGESTQLERRALKLQFWLQSKGWRLGHEISQPDDISFLSRLVPDEVGMSDGVFTKLYAVKKIVAPKGNEPVAKRCALGKSCMRSVAQVAAPVTSRSKYCSNACLGRARAVAAKLKS